MSAKLLKASARLGLVLMALASTAQASDFASFISNGVSLAYTTSGNGTPVILLHGLDGNSGSLLKPATDRFSQNFRVIGLDQRGHGRSGKPHEQAAYGKQMVTDVLNLMDALGIQRAHLVGHSMGGIVAMFLAAQHPQRVYSVVTIGNGLFSHTELKLIGWLMRGSYAWTDFKQWVGAAEPDPRPERDQVALLSVVQSLHELSVSEERAAAMKLPVLALRGGPEDDPNDTVERLVKINPSVKMLRLESEDHRSAVSCSPCLQSIEDFLLLHSPALARQPANEY